ncbi:unnamed protein product [Calypogeia fissa]
MAIMVTTGVLLGFISLLFWWFWRKFSLQPSLKLPPGPRPLPIVGNLLMMKKYGSMADLANELKRKYGPIVTLWICSKPVVMISDPEIIQEAMITQGSIFKGRPQFQSVKILLHGYRNLTYSMGERHRFLRKMLVSEILSTKRVAGFRPIREQEIDTLVESLKKKLGNGDEDNKKVGTVTNFRSMIRLTVCNLIVGVLFGRRLTLEEYIDLDAVMIKRLQLLVGKPRDFMSWLSWLPDRKAVKVQWELRRKISQILEPLIEERKQALKLEKPGHQTTYVDTLLELRDGKIQSPVEILDTDLDLICSEVLNTGTDTTALNLEYCVANLINNPKIQEKLAQEICEVVGERLVNEDDIPQLPYLQAVVKESLRRHSPARLAPPRRALSATKLAGYDIPVDTLVQQHLEGVSLSSQIWEDPLEFRPERHLNKPLDITGSTGITMIPFGVGRRICPAINIAFLHAELILARLVQDFQWNSVTPGQPLDLTPGGTFTSPMKYPLVAAIQERLNVSK